MAVVKYLKIEGNGGRLSYRREFPANLRPYVPDKAREFKRSLGCTDIGDPRCAQRFKAAGADYARLVALARKAASHAFDFLDSPTTALLVERYRVDLLQADEDRRHGMTADTMTKLDRLELHQNNLDGFQTEMEEADLGMIMGSFEDEAMCLLRGQGLYVDMASGEYRRLCVKLMEARIEVADVVVGRDRGALLPTPPAPSPPIPMAIASKGPEAPTPYTLNKLIEDFAQAKLEGVAPSTKLSFSPVFRLLRGVLGHDREVSTITRADGRRVFDAIKSLPANLTKLKDLEGLPFLDMLAKAKQLGLPVISPKTINVGYLAKASALFDWGRREGHLATNPIQGDAVRDPVDPADKRDPFTLPQLQAIFATAPWSPRDVGGGSPLKFWGPLIALFHGMRCGEIAQLDVADVVDREGVVVMLLRKGGGKRLKTSNARRMIPVHPELHSLGFMTFVEAQRTAGEAKLFPGNGPTSNGKWGVSFARWFLRLVESLDLEGQMLGLHSFRHNFEDRLREAELHDTPIGNEIAGRSKGSGSKNYGSGFSTAKLAAAIAGISYPGLDLSHLHAA